MACKLITKILLLIRRNQMKCLYFISLYLILIVILSILKVTQYPLLEQCSCNNQQTDKDFNLRIESRLAVLLQDHVYDFERKNDWSQAMQDIYVYSAYIDKCPLAVSSTFCVIFVGITLFNLTEMDISSINCAFKEKSKIIKGGSPVVEKLPEHHSKPYLAALIYCDLTSFVKDVIWPDQATLYKSSISTWYSVKYLPIQSSAHKISLNLCIRPLYGSYSEIRMLEFFAYYSTMGIEQYTLYYQNVSETLNAFLRFLKLENVTISVLPWTVPLENDLLHEYGQIAFTQDCLIRSRYKFSHTLIVDLDEFIVPKLHSSITGLVAYLDEHHKNAGSYTIQMVLFCDEYTNDKQNYSMFNILNRNKRQKTPWPHGYRSKYIARSNKVEYGGIHLVFKHEKSWSEFEVSETIALVHHYRRCCGLIQPWFAHLHHFNVLKDKIIVDNSLKNLAYGIVNDSLVLHALM